VNERRTLTTRYRVLLWAGVLAAPLAWVVHLFVGYEIDEAVCANGTGTDKVESAIAWLTAGLGTVAVLGGLAAAIVALRVRSGAITDPRGRVAFMAWSGVAASVLCLAIIVLVASALFSLDACGR
jgi:hypothetical protein